MKNSSNTFILTLAAINKNEFDISTILEDIRYDPTRHTSQLLLFL